MDYQLDHIKRSYALMKQDHIPGFLNKIAVNSCKSCNTFEAKEGECPSLHVIKFRLHILGLGIGYPEDCLRKCLCLL